MLVQQKGRVCPRGQGAVARDVVGVQVGIDHDAAVDKTVSLDTARTRLRLRTLTCIRGARKPAHRLKGANRGAPREVRVLRAWPGSTPEVGGAEI
jgi:hypothetical protein